MTYKLVLADDHQLLIEGIIAVLQHEQDIEVVATVDNGYDLVDAVAKHLPHLVLLDLNMPGSDGLSSLKRLKREHQQVKVLVLTNYNQPELVDEVKKLNAEGFMVKNSSASELKDVIRQILAGKKYYPSSDDLEYIKDNSPFLDSFLRKHNLTKREVMIIQLICREMSSKEIAGKLFLSELTVKTHRRNVMRKLELKSIAALMNFAKENAIV